MRDLDWIIKDNEAAWERAIAKNLDKEKRQEPSLLLGLVLASVTVAVVSILLYLYFFTNSPK